MKNLFLFGRKRRARFAQYVMKGRARNGEEEEARQYWSEIFDAKWYLSRNPDIALAGVDPFEHFIRHGLKEGRSPAPHVRANTRYRGPHVKVDQLSLGADGVIEPSNLSSFDVDSYLRDNPDVAAALPHDPAKLEAHWRTHGFRERRGVYGLAPYAGRSFTATFWQKRRTITCYGLFEAPSGLGTASRGYLEALRIAGYDVKPVTVRERNGRFFLDEPTPQSKSQLGSESRVNIYFLNADMMHLFFLDGRQHCLDDSFNIGIWFWELAHFPSHWFNIFGSLDEIWVASEFCRSSIFAISPIPVVLLPPPVTLATPSSTLPRTHFRVGEDVFVFGAIFDVGSTIERKNPAATIHAFQAAFGDDDRVMLALKYHGAHHYPGTVKSLHDIARLSRNIRFFGTVMEREELFSFKSMLDCVVSSHRSEGFGLNLIEAMLMDKPVIATDYSGSRDFLSEKTGFPVNFQLRDVGAQIGPYLGSALWADASEEDLCRTMKEVFANGTERILRSARGRKGVESQYSVNAAGEAIKKRLESLGLFNERPGPLRSWGAAVRAANRWSDDQSTRFTVVISVSDGSPKLLVSSVNSVLRQYHRNLELILVYEGASIDTQRILESLRGRDPRIRVLAASKYAGVNTAVEHSSGDFIAFLCHADELEETALEQMVEAIRANKQADVLYSDEENIDLEGRSEGDYYKPDWAPELLESTNYVQHLLVVRRSLFLQIGGFRAGLDSEQTYDFVLRASCLARAVIHVPEVLYYRRPEDVSHAGKENPTSEDASAIQSLQDYLSTSKRQGTVVKGMTPGSYRIRDELPNGLPVTLVIFTDNRSSEILGRGKINLFDHFAQSILDKTETRCSMKIMAVDNGNLSTSQRAFIARKGGRVVSYESPPGASFNFAKKANFAFREVETQHFVMLNDDMEIAEPGWLEALMELAIRPTTGVVGARLLFPDNTIQHCGIVLGVHGGAAHLYHRKPSADIGYNGFTHTIRNYSAVTGACMAMKTNLVTEIGGFDEKLAIDYNDIDFCLRAMAAGYRNIYTPFATLYHFEGQTEERLASNPNERRLFQERWASVLSHDPHYNPHLSRDSVDFKKA